MTLKGPCPKCNRSVVARRVKSRPEGEPPPTPKATRSGRTVRDVKAYATDDEPPRRPGRAARVRPAPIPDGPELEGELDDEPASPPASPAPSTTSPSPSRPAPVPESPTVPSTSTPTSTEPDLELADGLEFLAGGLFELFGQTMNRMARVRRRGQPTERWIVTDEEAEAFAAPGGADRRAPPARRAQAR